ncbi:MAG: hypothetical protein EA411_09315 [Saprospirales bacterium]|nr:MAG: hypothetical protein EA411_09315 [Saprospirales bacterium]
MQPFVIKRGFRSGLINEVEKGFEKPVIHQAFKIQPLGKDHFLGYQSPTQWGWVSKVNSNPFLIQPREL